VSEEDALRLATYKTACLFSGCARLGAVWAALKAEEQALADYGRTGWRFSSSMIAGFTASASNLANLFSAIERRKVTCR